MNPVGSLERQPAGLSWWVLYGQTKAIATSLRKVAYNVKECTGRIAWVFREQALSQIALDYHPISTLCSCASLGMFVDLSILGFLVYKMDCFMD